MCIYFLVWSMRDCLKSQSRIADPVYTENAIVQIYAILIVFPSGQTTLQHHRQSVMNNF